MEELSENLIEEIAIIGFAGRFPGARNIYEYWKNLVDGIESIKFFTDEELSDTIAPDLKANPNYIKARAVLDDAEYFDASFFDISHREAEIIDPQQRVFLECAWEALESAGYNPTVCPNVVSVYAGVDLSSYIMNVFSNREVVESMGVLQAIMNNDKDHLCTRVSHRLNLQGGSITVQSACSTSLVAVHMACRALLTFECDMALAGGSSVKFPQESGYFFQEGGITSPDGHCRAFDHKAKGTIAGSGVGLVVLKRLSDAIADGDFIHAVIKATAINNDGSSKMSYAAPSVEGQAEVIAMTHDIAEINPETISYVEAHGTGTSIGDPIEIEALTKAFRRNTDKKNFCGVGSVKTNIGHLDAAAGIAGLIKTILALKHKQIPPTLHFEKPNPNIDFANSPFYVNDKLSDWNTDELPRRAGVSAYGMGGTNVHVIVEEYENEIQPDKEDGLRILTISGHTKPSLGKNTEVISQFLKQNPETNLSDAAYTLQKSRKSFIHRRFIIGKNNEEIIDAIDGNDDKRIFTETNRNKSPKTIWLFPGQGSQFPKMGFDLYQKNSIFKDYFDRCVEILTPLLGLDIREILFPADEDIKKSQENLKQTKITQPVLFAFEYALAKTLEKFNVKPFAMIGHSVGEYVAACIAGVFSLEDGLKLITKRGELMQSLPHGSMLAVSLSEKEIQPYISEKVSLATINSPNMCVLSGETDEVEKVKEQLDAKDIFCRLLQTSHAFHSAMMEPILGEFRDVINSLTLNKPQIPFISNLTGKRITDEEATDAEYWVKHIRNAVRFSENVEQLLDEGELIWLEVGAGQTLANLTKQHFENPNSATIVQLAGGVQDKLPDEMIFLKALGQLWQNGVNVEWKTLYGENEPRRIMLPTYQFDRKKYWLKFNAGQTPGDSSTNRTDVMPLDKWFYVPVWKQMRPLTAKSPAERSQDKIALIFDEKNKAFKDIESLSDETEILKIKIGNEFVEENENEFKFNPHSADDFQKLFTAFIKNSNTPDVIVYALPLTGSEKHDDTAEEFKNELEEYFYPLLNLTKAIVKANILKPLNIIVMTDNLDRVTGSEEIRAEKSTLAGLCKVITQENPNLNVSIIDTDKNGISENFNGKFKNYLLEDHVVREYRLATAFRNKSQWELNYENIDLQKTETENSRIKEGGTYLITGGLGGVGLILARHLANNYKANLVLLGRSGFPQKTAWDDYPNPDSKDESKAEKIRILKEFESFGANVLVLSADVSDKKQLAEAFDQAEEMFGKIDGVIHGAGVSGNRSVRTIPETGVEECNWHFEPKVFGLQNLSEIIEGRNIEFCLLLSSLSAVLGGLGFTAYSAANNYMDAFVRKNNRHSKTLWQTVDWDGWLVGGAMPSFTNRFSMTPEEGCEAFERIVNSANIEAVVVSKGSLPNRIETWLNLAHKTETSETQTENEKELYSRPDLSSEFLAPATPIEEAIENAWSEILGVENVGVNDNFFELGGHSLLATQLVSRMRRLFDVDLPLRTFFENPTIKGLANVVIEHQSESLNDDELERFTKDIEGLSDEEIQRLLESEKEQAV